jgi:secreted Zn-dependent insulinase-like peptidase
MTNPNCEITDKKLDLPPQNTLIPKNFEILPKDESKSEKPILLKSWEDCTDLWYKKDDNFLRPKCMIQMKLYTNDLLFSLKPETRVFAKVWRSIQ